MEAANCKAGSSIVGYAPRFACVDEMTVAAKQMLAVVS
jgi:hypothetical protein